MNRLIYEDLCMRLPFRVKVKSELSDYFSGTLVGINEDEAEIIIDTGNRIKHSINGDNLKPILRPLDSMSDKEKEEYTHLSSIEGFKWLIRNGFDANSLIEQGLAYLNETTA